MKDLYRITKIKGFIQDNQNQRFIQDNQNERFIQDNQNKGVYTG